MGRHKDVAPPGREKQVRALKEKPGIDNPYAVAWASYNKSDGPEYDASTCPACHQPAPVAKDDTIEAHVAPGGAYDAMDIGGRMPGSDSADVCPGSGATRMDHIVHRGGKWLLIAKSTGKVLGTHESKAEAEAQERAVQASKHADGGGARVRRFERSDFSNTLPRPEKTAEGFWRVAGKVARTGIQEYRDSSGGVRRELRLPQEVRASLPSFALQPLTNNHPPQMLTPDNAKRFAVGAVGEAQMDDGWVTAPMTIYDAAAIASVEGGRAQLSVGYSCRVDDESGIWEGQKYDAVQRDIVVNHVAIVDTARAGAEARIRLDAGDAISQAENRVVAWTHQVTEMETNPMPHKMTLDGFTIELTDANAEAVIARAIESARKQGDKAAKKADERADAAEQAKDATEKNLAEKQKAFDALQGKHDALDAKIKADAAETFKLDGADVLMADFRDPVKREAILSGAISKAASARTALVIEARKHLGDKEKLDGKSDLEVKKMVVAKLDKTAKLDGRSEDYVQARYDAVIEQAESRKVSPIDQARGAATGNQVQVVVDAAPTNADEARQAMIRRTLQANPKNNVR